jgi:hypothetical protein
MHISRRIVLALVAAALLAGSAVTAASAIAAPVTPVLTTSLAPSVPTDPVLHGVTPGSAPWVLKKSATTLNDGLLVANIQGLIIPELGTPGPVSSVDVALYCANETTPAAMTKTFPLSERGNALIVERVELPSTCLTPALLINPLGIGSIYIATSGFAANQSEPLGQSLLVTSLAPSVPTDPVLHGVTAGSAPWVIKQSTAALTDGLLVVDIDGLIIPELGTPGPVKSVDAALYCANETTPAAMTGTFPLSERGNALIVERVKLPSTCLTPALLINPLGIGSIYIATSGFTG